MTLSADSRGASGHLVLPHDVARRRWAEDQHSPGPDHQLPFHTGRSIALDALDIEMGFPVRASSRLSKWPSNLGRSSFNGVAAMSLGYESVA